MNHIYCILGKSCSGKDTLYKALKEKYSDHMNFVVRYTTRPKRENEKEGEEYNFVTSEKLSEYKKNKKIIESENFDTHGEKWEYATHADSINLNKDSIIIVSLGAFRVIKERYGSKIVQGIYLEASKKTRFKRSLKRGNENYSPEVKKKICQRIAKDENDFYNAEAEMEYKINTEGKLSDIVSDVEKLLIDKYL